MSIESTTTRVSFMMSGPAFDLSVPSSLGARVAGMSPIQLPTGGRECAFQPISTGRPGYSSDEFDASELVDGIDTEVWVTRRHASPIHWFLDWHLETGTVSTHVRDEDGEEMVKVVAQRLEIIEDGTALPTLLPHDPLGRAASRAPGYAEVVRFRDVTSDPGGTLTLLRPGSMAAGLVREVDNHIYLGTKAAIDIEARNVTRETLESIREQIEGQIGLA